MRMLRLVLVLGVCSALVLAVAGCNDAATSTTTSTTLATLGEMPRVPLDADMDGMITADELATSYAKMHEIVKIIGEYDSSRATELDAQITALEKAGIDQNMMRDMQETYKGIAEVWEAVRLSQ